MNTGEKRPREEEADLRYVDDELTFSTTGAVTTLVVTLLGDQTLVEDPSDNGVPEGRPLTHRVPHWKQSDTEYSCWSAGHTVHTCLKAKSPGKVRGETKRLTSESRKTPTSSFLPYLLTLTVHRTVKRRNTLHEEAEEKEEPVANNGDTANAPKAQDDRNRFAFNRPALTGSQEVNKTSSPVRNPTTNKGPSNADPNKGRPLTYGSTPATTHAGNKAPPLTLGTVSLLPPVGMPTQTPNNGATLQLAQSTTTTTTATKIVAPPKPQQIAPPPPQAEPMQLEQVAAPPPPPPVQGGIAPAQEEGAPLPSAQEDEAQQTTNRRKYINIDFAPRLATTKVSLTAFQEWIRKSRLNVLAPQVTWTEAECSEDGRITVPIYTNLALNAIRDSLDDLADNSWALLTWIFNGTLEELSVPKAPVMYIAPLVAAPIPQGNTLIAINTIINDTPNNSLWGPSTHWEYHKVKTAATFHIWSRCRRDEIIGKATATGIKIHPIMPEEGREDHTARIVYNNALDIKLRTCDIEDVMDTFVPIGDAPNIVGQLYDPETETLQQKWLIGFCDSHKADYFHQNYRTWFENAEIDPRFKFKLTLGQCKTKPKDNVKTAGRGRGRGRGRGAATRGRGK